MLYSHNNQYPGDIPERIRLSSGLTRTGKDYTEEELLDAGYKLVADKPSCETDEIVEWNSTTGEWSTRKKTIEESIAENDLKWETVKQLRDNLLKESDWTQLDDAFLNKTFLAESLKALWLQYRLALRTVTQQSSPSSVVWPKPPTDEDAHALMQVRNRENYEFLVNQGLINE